MTYYECVSKSKKTLTIITSVGLLVFIVTSIGTVIIQPINNGSTILQDKVTVESLTGEMYES